MVYSNKFVMCVLVNGVAQEELADGTINLPFGCEYVLRFRNKNSRRACVDIYIDNECVSGPGYVIDAHEHVDIKRHHDVDRAFKFVSLNSSEAIEHGKNGPNDDKTKGVIEARFRLEKERVTEVFKPVPYPYPYPYPYPVPTPRPWREDPWRPYYKDHWVTCDDGSRNQWMIHKFEHTASDTLGLLRSSSFSPRSFTPPTGTPIEDGCTVEGHSTGQRFHSVHIDLESTETVLKISLRGFEDILTTKPRRQKRKKNRVCRKEEQIIDLQRQIDELKKQIKS